MVDKKLRFAMLTKFKKGLSARGLTQNINMFKEQWAADAMIESYGYDECLEAMDAYLANYKNPDWTWFSYNIDSVIEAKHNKDEDDRVRALLRKGAKEWLEK